MKNKTYMIILILVLGGCSNTIPLDDYSHYLRNKKITTPTTQNFPHCYDYGCKTIKSVSLSKDGWKRLNTIFKSASPSAKEERRKISKAIQIFETDIGAQIGTSADLKGTFTPLTRKTDSPLRFQQDCVDESTNTTIYLSVLDQKGWLTFHRVTQPQSRQPLLGGNRWWHQSATIKETDSNQQYAVDSWFADNGAPAYIVKIDDWFNNWSPRKATKN
jgi:hypothetical protein